MGIPKILFILPSIKAVTKMSMKNTQFCHQAYHNVHLILDWRSSPKINHTSLARSIPTIITAAKFPTPRPRAQSPRWKCRKCHAYRRSGQKTFSPRAHGDLNASSAHYLLCKQASSFAGQRYQCAAAAERAGAHCLFYHRVLFRIHIRGQ